MFLTDSFVLFNRDDTEILEKKEEWLTELVQKMRQYKDVEDFDERVEGMDYTFKWDSKQPDIETGSELDRLDPGKKGLKSSIVDRILVKEESFEGLSYQRGTLQTLMGKGLYRLSDHNPVRAMFTLDLLPDSQLVNDSVLQEQSKRSRKDKKPVVRTPEMTPTDDISTGSDIGSCSNRGELTPVRTPESHETSTEESVSGGDQRESMEVVRTPESLQTTVDSAPSVHSESNFGTFSDSKKPTWDPVELMPWEVELFYKSKPTRAEAEVKLEASRAWRRQVLPGKTRLGVMEVYPGGYVTSNVKKRNRRSAFFAPVCGGNSREN